MQLRIIALPCAIAAFSPNGAAAQSSPSAFTTTSRYDLANRLTGVIAPDPDGPGGNGRPAERYWYDAAGRLSKIETGTLADWQPETVTPAAWVGFTILTRTETSYDNMGRKVREQIAKGAAGTVRSLAQYSYDAVGRLECSAVRMNPAAFDSLPASACVLGPEGSTGPDRITRNFYDAAGQLLKVQKAAGTAVQIDYARYEYTPNGKQKAVIDANGNRAQFSYDGFDRHVKWAFPSKTVVGEVSAVDYEEYGYDANSNRTSLRKRDGRTIAYGYDALNRVTSKTYPSGGARPVYYAYDLRGLQIMARFDSLSGQGITNAYDGFGRLTATTAVMTLGTTEVIRNLNFVNDANGNRTRITYPDNQYVSAAWDGLDRFYFHNIAGGTNLNYVTYNAEGEASTLLRWAAGTWGASTSFGYNGMSQLVSHGHSFQNSTANVTTSFSYNSARQIISQTRDNIDYRFDGHTNINRDYTSNGLNQYTAAGNTSFSYDLNGNLTAEGAKSYTYDIENRLVSASTGTMLVTLSYDPLGRLAQVSTSAGATTQFLYDGDALVAEYDGTGAMIKRYVHGPAVGRDDPLVEYAGPDVTSPRHLIADHLGSIIAIADSNGNRTAVNGYDAYGIPNGVISGGTPNTGRFQYTGQAWIPELGMYYYKARIYSPTLGRFLQTDPVGYEDQINLYAYVGNDPINGRDPTGKCRITRDGVEIGICGNTTEAQDKVDAQIENKNSIAKSVEALAVAKGVRVGFEIRDGDPNLHGGNYDQTRGQGGTITFDKDDIVRIENPDGSSHFSSDAETIEHEINNAKNRLEGGQRQDIGDEAGPSDHGGSIDAENLLRQRSGIAFRRQIGAGGSIFSRKTLDKSRSFSIK